MSEAKSIPIAPPGMQLRLPTSPAAKLSILASLFYLGCFAYFTYRTRVLRPFADQIDLLELFFRFEERGSWIEYLLEPHTVHRIPWYRMLLAFDVVALRGTTVPFLVVAALCLATVAVILCREVAAASSGPLKLPAIAFTLVMLFGTSSAANLSVPANTPAMHALFFGILAIWLAVPTPETGNRSITARRLGAIAACVGAAFSNAVGLVLWPVLAFKAWRGGPADRPWLLLVLITGLAFGLAYLAGPSAADAAPTTLSFDALIKAADYLLAYLGMPWARAFGGVGRFIGLLMLTSSLIVILTRGGQGAPRSERVAVALIMLSLGTAVLAAWARKDVTELVDVPARYRIYVAPLHIGLAMVALPWLERRWRDRRRTIEAAIIACLCVLAVQQVLVGEVAAAAAQRARATITAFHRGQHTADVRWLIADDLGHAQAICDELRRHGIYFHGPGAPRLW